jgi:antitoxin ChpS
MAIELSIQKWGNSAAIRLPAPLLSQLNLHLGDKVTAKICNEGLMLIPVKKRYSLDELLAQCDTQAQPPQDVAAWLDAPAVGDEIW